MATVLHSGHTTPIIQTDATITDGHRPEVVLGNATATSAVLGQGAASIASGQVTASGTAGTLIAARATRRAVTVKNTDATITVYVGPATVTAGNGLPLKAGESMSIDATALIQVIAASGAPVVAYLETYD